MPNTIEHDNPRTNCWGNQPLDLRVCARDTGVRIHIFWWCIVMKVEKKGRQVRQPLALTAERKAM